MLSINQRFGIHFSCHLQGECVCVVGLVLERQAEGGELDLMVLIGGAEEWAAIQWEKSIFFSVTSFPQQHALLPFNVRRM
jgi:hypothetical protein